MDTRQEARARRIIRKYLAKYDYETRKVARRAHLDGRHANHADYFAPICVTCELTVKVSSNG